MSSVKIPDISDLLEIAETHNISLNEFRDPIESFEIYDSSEQSVALCLISPEYDLFNINIIRPKRKLLNSLNKVKYGLPVEHLIEDVFHCISTKDFISRDYENYWVQIELMDEEELLMEYRKFVE